VRRHSVAILVTLAESLGSAAGVAIAIAGCQTKAEPGPPRPPAPVIEARAHGAALARVVASRPCRAEIDGNELLVGTEPLVAQIGSTRWSGDRDGATTTLRRDGVAIVSLRDTADRSIEILDAAGGALLRISSDGEIANARGQIVRRGVAAHAAIQIDDAVVTGTSDLPLAGLLTAPELIPEVRALAACHRLVDRQPQARK
jgi:hypothetical protein